MNKAKFITNNFYIKFIIILPIPYQFQGPNKNIQFQSSEMKDTIDFPIENRNVRNIAKTMVIII